MVFPWQPLLEYIVLLGAACGVMFALYIKIRKPTMNFLRDKLGISDLVNAHAQVKTLLHLQFTDAAHDRDRMDKELKQQTATLNKIYEQLTVNGGNVTIKDDLSTIKNQFNSVIALANEAIFTNDPEGRCIEANAALCDLFGTSKEHLTGYGWVNFLPDEEKEQKRSNWMNAIKNDTFIKDTYHVINGETGERMLCEYSANITRGRNDKIQSIVGKVKRIDK